MTSLNMKPIFSKITKFYGIGDSDLRNRVIAVCCIIIPILLIGVLPPSSYSTTEYSHTGFTSSLASSRDFELYWRSLETPQWAPLQSDVEVTGDQIEVWGIYPEIDERPDMDIVNVSWGFGEGDY
jgi:hypothetical protein